MKISAIFSLTLAVGANAFVVTPQRQCHLSTTSLDATKKAGDCQWGTIAAGAFAGFTLATQVAMASPVTIQESQQVLQSYPSTVIAAGAYVPETGYDSMDMSLPSYKVQDDLAASMREKEKAASSTQISLPAPQNKAEAKEQAKARAAAKREAEVQKILAEKKAKADAKASKSGDSAEEPEKLTKAQKKELAMAKAAAKREAEVQAMLEKKQAK